MICAHPPSRKILDPVARPLYCRMADWRSFTSGAIVIASSVHDQIRSVPCSPKLFPYSNRTSISLICDSNLIRKKSGQAPFGHSPNLLREIFEIVIRTLYNKSGNVAHSCFECRKYLSVSSKARNEMRETPCIVLAAHLVIVLHLFECASA